jgi:hypothetical protein
MSDRIITERDIRTLKRQAKLRARADKTSSYMQHLDALSYETFGENFQQVKANSHEARAASRLASAPMSFYLQACQDAYFDL